MLIIQKSVLLSNLSGSNIINFLALSCNPRLFIICSKIVVSAYEIHFGEKTTAEL